MYMYILLQTFGNIKLESTKLTQKTQRDADTTITQISSKISNVIFVSLPNKKQNPFLPIHSKTYLGQPEKAI